jgi:hypothetical protein
MTLIFVSTYRDHDHDRNLPVEEVHPQDPSLVPVDFDTSKPQSLLTGPLRAALLGGGRQERNETDNVQANSRDHLQELVLDKLVLAERILVGSLLFLADEDRGRDGGEDERVQKTKGEGLVLLWDHGRQEGGEHRQENHADLGNVEALEAWRRIVRETDELHDGVLVL